MIALSHVLHSGEDPGRFRGKGTEISGGSDVDIGQKSSQDLTRHRGARQEVPP